MILLIDNYDSFTYNLYQYMGIFNPDIIVKRNDEITIEDIKEVPGIGESIFAQIKDYITT